MQKAAYAASYLPPYRISLSVSHPPVINASFALPYRILAVCLMKRACTFNVSNWRSLATPPRELLSFRGVLIKFIFFGITMR